MATVELDYLISDLRLHLGDMDDTCYRYLDAWLLSSLIVSVKALQRWWNYKYLINDSDETYRNPNWSPFLFPEPPVIERGDERPIILMASLVIKEGSAESSSWSISSWKDAEIAYSNIAAGKIKSESILRDKEELETLVQPPGNRLATPLKGSLPGYLGNVYERSGLY